MRHMAVLAAGMRPTAAQRHQRRRAEKAFQPIVVEAHAQAMADQARGHRIEHLLEGEPASRGDGDYRLNWASRQRVQEVGRGIPWRI
jgi:hypothetical protein